MHQSNVSVVAALLLFVISPSAVAQHYLTADVLIGGGSLSALAAAVSASQAAQSLNSSSRIVLLEPTDWPGGQLTASNVPPDFGTLNHVPENLPQSFVELLIQVAGPTWLSNPGSCWVSYKCFESYKAAAYIKTWLEKLPNLHVYYNTMVKEASTNTKEEGKVTISKVTAIQRWPKGDRTGYEGVFSENVQDWYSFEDSDQFTKKIIIFEGFKVVIDATEFGDIMMTAGVPTAQGFEYPGENSDMFDSSCGQSTVFPFVMTYFTYDSLAMQTVPQGFDGGIPFKLTLPLEEVWAYRRTRAIGSASNSSLTKGEISNINLDNDYSSGYMFLTYDELQSQLSDWKGGLNIEALSGAEQRSYAYYHFLKSKATNYTQSHFRINTLQSGTSYGLTKFPYVRDTRRSQRGLGGFRLTYADLSFRNPEDGGITARHFNDTIALGNYLYADIHALASGICKSHPSNILSARDYPIQPYYIPFRALTAQAVQNILIPGKGMAQSFVANAGTRLHPSEYSSGVAAGAAAVLMAYKSYESTQQVYDNIDELQNLIRGPAINSPLKWTFEYKTM